MSDVVATLRIDPTSATPPYEQLRTGIAGLVASGRLPPGTRLPTVRRLAADLGLAANTVARSYRELEADAVLRTEGRRGTFVPDRELAGSASEALTRSAADFVTAARRAGLSSAEAVRLVERAWAG